MKRIIFSLIMFSVFYTVTSQEVSVYEGFENWPPTNWGIYELGDALNGWQQDWQGISHTGDHSAYNDIDNNQCDNWLVTPQINVSSNDYILRYWDLNDSPEYYDKVSVLISTGSGNPNDGEFVENFVVTNLNLVWEETTIDLSSYFGQDIYIAFRFEGTWHKYFVDDVLIGPTNFVDGAITAIVNPTGVSETPVTENIIVTVQNKGSLIINEIDISWDVNGTPQPAYNNVSLNLQPGTSIDLTIGSFNFETTGTVYNISTNLNVVGDINNTNDSFQGSFTISEFKDAVLSGISPESLIPSEGIKDVIVTITNAEASIINDLQINWTVEGVNQTPYLANGLNLILGESVQLVIGQFNFYAGVYQIEATVDVLGDNNPDNNTYISTVSVDTFWESFEGNVFPPNNWSVIFGIKETGFETPIEGEYYYSSQPDNNIFGEVSDTIYTPRLSIQSGDTFTFNIKPSAFLAATHTVVVKNPTTGDVILVQELSPIPDQWQEMTVDLSAVQGNYHIGITSSVIDFPGLTVFDVFSSTAKLHLYDNDLSIIEGDMYYLAKKDVNEAYIIRVKNEGALTVLGGDYTVKLMENGSVLGTANGVTLNSWEETNITINHTFTNIESHRLYFEIDYASDENPSDNVFRETTVSVVPSTAILDEMQPKNNVDLNMPFNANGSTNSLGEDDLTQSIFLSQEFINPGEIYGIVYSYDNLLETNAVKELPLQVWISQTQLTNLENGFLPYEDLVMVFDGVVEILPGNRHELYIPFDQPIGYTGLENVIIQNYQYSPEWPPAILRFYNSSDTQGETRTIALLDVYDLDPTDPGVGWTSFDRIPHTQFVIDPTLNYSVLSGTVYDTNNVPINNATVSIDGTTLTEQSDANGYYSFPDIAYGTYSVTATSFGYNDENISLTLDASAITHDFYLNIREQIDIIGTVFGSNNLSIPLENVQVSIDGYIFDSTTTDNAGDFSFSNVYGNSDYEAIFSFYGYLDTVVTVSVIDQNIDMGNVILAQEFISPFDVEADTDAGIMISWNDPLESSKVKIQNDLDEISGSYTNEPFENVWLGNIISISEITTLTSVEIRTDIYQLFDGVVSIDVFDIATEEIIASSEPFIIYPSATQIINIPNIVVYNDVAVMVHWQNNEFSTNALVVDYSDPGIVNSAIIKYTGQPFTLLSDVVGVPPNTSFMVRLNTLDDGNPDTNNEVLSYNVYRGLASEFPDITNWDTLNATPVSDTSFEDTDSGSLDPSEFYRYAIETVYVEGVSDVTFSNIIDGNILGIDDNEVDVSSIILYPVPTKEVLTISFGNVEAAYSLIIISDVQGRIVAQIDPSNINNGKLKVNVSHYSDGIYFVKIKVDGQSVSKKIIIGH